MIKDYRGTPIVEGATVAFNYSGEVRIGTLVKVSRHKSRGHAYNIFHVEHPYGTSKVTSENNLVVINELDKGL